MKRTSATVLLVVLLSGCADTINPVLGRLSLGRDTGPLKPPVRVDGGRFAYPEEAWEDRVGGTVWLRLHITSVGRVDSVTVLESSGNATLDSAARADGSGLRFSPAQKGGEPVSVWAHLEVIYPLPQEVIVDEP